MRSFPRRSREDELHSHEMWRPHEAPWQYRLLDALPASVDSSQLERALQMTPTERIEAMCALLRAGEQLRNARRGAAR